MPTPVQNLIKIHSSPEIDSNGLKHGWTIQDTSHIRNVSLIASHALLQCPCGWRGWVKKDALTKFTQTSKESR